MQIKDTQNLLQWAIKEFQPEIALACSFSIEDITIAHMLTKNAENTRVFALDTGRLNEETYQCANILQHKLGIRIDWYFPRNELVEQMENDKGVFAFRESIKARHVCCRIRKVEPLSRALSNLKAWITGLRREQSVTRNKLEQVEKDGLHGGIIKINPLADWKTEDVWAYIKQNNLPYNRLYDLGYKSIGCAPCTREVKPGEEERAGRWWWEDHEHKECGLHVGNHVVQTNSR
ncbi:MAG: phosphoadenosine phosphosulfate reductase [Lentisphaerae bacterium RIFOXYA12_FULL_48_11]|nr:MAG: phosphoadenosine phosphosulfate reductase [Lentisphaerae bacterium RIFOXYA12_FULL_48_11]